MKITQLGFQQNLIGSTDDFRKRRMIVLIASAAWVMSFFSFLTVVYFKEPGETLIQTLAYPEAF